MSKADEMSAEGVGVGARILCVVRDVVTDFFDSSLILVLALVFALWAIIMFTLPHFPYPS